MADLQKAIDAVARLIKESGGYFALDGVRPDGTAWLVIDASMHVPADEAEALLDALLAAEKRLFPEGDESNDGN